MIEFTGQLIGFVALIIVVIAYQAFNDRHFYILKSITYVLLCVHFAMIGAVTGALQQVVNTSRNLGFLAGYYRIAVYGAICAFAIFGIMTAETTIDSLPVISNILCSLAMLFLSGLALRIVYWSGGLLWLVYSIAVGSYAGFIIESIVLISASIGIIRMARARYKLHHGRLSAVARVSHR